MCAFRRSVVRAPMRVSVHGVYMSLCVKLTDETGKVLLLNLATITSALRRLPNIIWVRCMEVIPLAAFLQAQLLARQLRDVVNDVIDRSMRATGFSSWMKLGNYRAIAPPSTSSCNSPFSEIRSTKWIVLTVTVESAYRVSTSASFPSFPSGVIFEVARCPSPTVRNGLCGPLLEYSRWNSILETVHCKNTISVDFFSALFLGFSK